MTIKLKGAAGPKKETASKVEKSEGFAVIPRVIKGDTYMVMSSTQMEVEDEFADLYWTTTSSQNVFVTPPFEPRGLMRLVQHNNILSQCVDAMEVNIDGTGFNFVPGEGVANMDAGEAEKLTEFFTEPYPGKSMIQLRRSLRRDLESIGWGFLEVLRTADGKVAVLRNIPAWTVRYVRLDNAVSVQKTIQRNGESIQINLQERERRFGQKIGPAVVYFREFGTSRQLSKTNGKWEDPGNPVAMEDRASELIAFQVNPDVYSPYGVPRWINQLPSVLGSRKAEESNLEFFDSGGIPPAIIFVQGGTLAPKVSEQLRTYLSGQSTNRNRAVVVEAQASGGNLDGPPGNVQVRVERFGAERANDALFMGYDQRTEDHVRTGFRLPPLFLGKAADYNFATAKVAYMVAESQVFQPERTEFDEVMNKTVVAELGAKTAILKSMPITLTDVQVQLEGATLVQAMVNGETLVEAVNDVTGLKLKYEAPPEPVIPEGIQLPPLGVPPKAKSPTGGGGNTNTNSTTPADKKAATPGAKTKVTQPGTTPAAKPKVSTKKIMKLAREYAAANGLIVVKGEDLVTDIEDIDTAVKAMDEADRQSFYEVVSAYTYGKSDKQLTSLIASACGHEH